MKPLDIALACAACGAPFLPVGGLVVVGIIDLIKLAEAAGWISDGRGGHIDPECVEDRRQAGVQEGVSAAIAGALTAERAHAAKKSTEGGTK